MDWEQKAQLIYALVLLTALGLLGGLKLWERMKYPHRKKMREEAAIKRNCDEMKAYLLKHDPDFQRQYISSEVVRRREQVREQGGSADQLDQIDMWSVAESLGINLWGERFSDNQTTTEPGSSDTASAAIR
jgi:hypothetical protein